MNGEWAVEAEGVPPDIEGRNDPRPVIDGGDPQLERAIEETLRLLKENPPKHPPKPTYPKK